MHPHSMLLRLAFLAALVAAPASVQAEEARRQFDVAAASAARHGFSVAMLMSQIVGILANRTLTTPRAYELLDRYRPAPKQTLVVSG